MKTNKLRLLVSIRQRCLECRFGDRVEVAECDDRLCPIWPYRRGTQEDPENPKLTNDEKCEQSKRIHGRNKW